MRNTAAIRLEGGLGDHLLGMRLLGPLRAKYPQHRIVAYSDAGGAKPQLQVVRMSPMVSEVCPVSQDPLRVTMSSLGLLGNLDARDLARIREADVFVDAYTQSLFLEQARMLDVSPFEVLASTPVLHISDDAKTLGARLLDRVDGQKFVGLNFAKYGLDILRGCLDTLRRFVDDLMTLPNTHLLHFYTRRHRFPHWPEPDRSRREQQAHMETAVLEEITGWYSDRCTAIIDEEISIVAALLARCNYFIGVDNGIKHLAWALGVPRTWIVPYRGLAQQWILRYAPDYHRMLQLGCSVGELERHIAAARSAVQSD